MRRTGVVRISKSLSLNYEGLYIAGDDDVNFSSEFQIKELSINEGELKDLLEWSFSNDPLYCIETLIIKDIEQEFSSKN